MNTHWKDWCWNSTVLVIWCEQLTHWKNPWCWERFRAEGDRASEDEMAGWHQRCHGHELRWISGDKDREAWHAAVRGVRKSWTWLDNWTTAAALEWPQCDLFKTHQVFKRIVLVKSSRVWLKESETETSLVAQWLRHRVPNAGCLRSSSMAQLKDPICWS